MEIIIVISVIKNNSNIANKSEEIMPYDIYLDYKRDNMGHYIFVYNDAFSVYQNRVIQSEIRRINDILYILGESNNGIYKFIYNYKLSYNENRLLEKEINRLNNAEYNRRTRERTGITS